MKKGITNILELLLSFILLYGSLLYISSVIYQPSEENFQLRRLPLESVLIHYLQNDLILDLLYQKNFSDVYFLITESLQEQYPKAALEIVEGITFTKLEPSDYNRIILPAIPGSDPESIRVFCNSERVNEVYVKRDWKSVKIYINQHVEIGKILIETQDTYIDPYSIFAYDSNGKEIPVNASVVCSPCNITVYLPIYNRSVVYVLYKTKEIGEQNFYELKEHYSNITGYVDVSDYDYLISPAPFLTVYFRSLGNSCTIFYSLSKTFDIQRTEFINDTELLTKNYGRTNQKLFEVYLPSSGMITSQVKLSSLFYYGIEDSRSVIVKIGDRYYYLTAYVG